MFGRRLIAVGLCGAAGLVFAACGGETKPATNVTSTSATLNAHASCQAGESGKWWFRWRPTGNPWRETPRNSYDCATDDAQDVSADLTGLTPATEYEYQVCVKPTNPFVAVCANADGHADNADRDPGEPTTRFTTLSGPPQPRSTFNTAVSPPPATGGIVVRSDTTPPSDCQLTSNPGESFAAFVSRLPAGQVGCLLAGTYDIGDFGHGSLDFKAGQTIHPVMTDATHYARVTLHGTVNIDVNNLTLHDLFFAGYTPTNFDKVIQVEGVSGATLDHLDITSDPAHIVHPGFGILWIGTAQGQAQDPSDMQITNNKIHDLGADGHYDHGIYGAGATTGGSAIIGNWIYGNAAFGIQMYPEASNLNLAYNVIDGNGALADCGTPPCPLGTTNGHGIIFYRDAANDVFHNGIISVFQGVSPDYGSVVYCQALAGNQVNNSLLYQAQGGITNIGCPGTGNISADPLYVDRANHDYRLAPGSPATALMGAYAQAVPGPRL
jgi:hypothetical protein